MAHAAFRPVLTTFVNHAAAAPDIRLLPGSGMSGVGPNWEKSIGLKRLCRAVTRLTLFGGLGRILVNGVYIAKNSPSFSACTKLARIVLVKALPGWRLLLPFKGSGVWAGLETGVARYRKLRESSLEASARNAQRGLLVILATALVWLLAIWAGYHLL
jgi:hypothetical protein